jgi:hypothetical protein
VHRADGWRNAGDLDHAAVFSAKVCRDGPFFAPGDRQGGAWADAIGQVSVDLARLEHLPSPPGRCSPRTQEAAMSAPCSVTRDASQFVSTKGRAADETSTPSNA